VKALTLYQPWGWAVASAFKLVENRTWRPPASIVGETIAIHGGKKYDKEGEAFLRKNGVVFPTAEFGGVGKAGVALEVGPRSVGILGVARIAGYVEKGSRFFAHRLPSGALNTTLLPPNDSRLTDPMFFGPIGFMLDRIQLCSTPIELKGAMGLFHVPKEVEAKLWGDLVGIRHYTCGACGAVTDLALSMACACSKPRWFVMRHAAEQHRLEGAP
jgi:hypothetical protein